MSKAKVIIITKGVSRIVKPLLTEANVIGIIQSSSKKKHTRVNRKINHFRRFVSFFIRKFSNLEDFSNRKNIPFYSMDNGSDEDLEKWVRNKEPDLIVIYMMSHLLKSNIYNIPKYKTINLHPSLLPDYRGPNPWFWMYYDKATKGGVTAHFIDDGEDTGDIIYQEEYNIPLGIKSPTLNDIVIGVIGVKLILKCIKNFKNLPRSKQVNEPKTVRARNIKKSEHLKLIDWENWNVEKVWHLLRGTELWLNAIDLPKGGSNGQRWLIEEYIECKTKTFLLGKTYREHGRYFVACRNGIIYIKLSLSLKKIVSNIIK